MTQHLWFSAFSVRSGFVMAEETQLAGKVCPFSVLLCCYYGISCQLVADFLEKF